MQLLRCCGLERPWERGKTELVIQATGGSGFVTIHDFISAVHPYLMARRGDILKAINVDPANGGKQFGPETGLMVEWQCATTINVRDEPYWINCHTRNRPKPAYVGGMPYSVFRAKHLALVAQNKMAVAKPEPWESEEE